MNLIRCDHCGHEAPGSERDPALGWFIVEASVYSIAEPPRRHFCSQACVGNFYTGDLGGLISWEDERDLGNTPATEGMMRASRFDQEGVLWLPYIEVDGERWYLEASVKESKMETG